MDGVDLALIALCLLLLITVVFLKRTLPSENSPIKDERRKEQRKVLTSPVNYSCTWMDEKGMKHVDEIGTTHNISRSGISLYCQSPLYKGLEIRVSSRTAYDPTRKGTVIWCKKLKKNLFRIGVLFK